MTKKFQLHKNIISLSVSDNWDHAKLEWKLDYVNWTDEPETCLCGHYPINELCVVLNTRNDKRAIVGNCCIKQFFNWTLANIIPSMKRISKDEDRSASLDAIRYALEKRWFDEQDFKFYKDIRLKRSLSERQLKWKRSLNRRLLANIRQIPKNIEVFRL